MRRQSRMEKEEGALLLPSYPPTQTLMNSAAFFFKSPYEEEETSGLQA